MRTEWEVVEVIESALPDSIEKLMNENEFPTQELMKRKMFQHLVL
jgi:hypothetical protein